MRLSILWRRIINVHVSDFPPANRAGFGCKGIIIGRLDRGAADVANVRQLHFGTQPCAAEEMFQSIAYLSKLMA